MSFGAAAFAAYRGAGWIAAPLARPHLASRAARGKEDPTRTEEKRGVASASLSERPVWLHAVSVGESVAALALATRLEAAGFTVLFTTGTPTAAARIAAEAPHLTHQYAPLDAPPFVERFLAHWRPRAALFTEAEIWPTTLHMLARQGVPRAHINARLSRRSFRSWHRTGPLGRYLFGLIPLALAQSPADAQRFFTLGVSSAQSTGNLKFDAPPPAAPHQATQALRHAIGDRPVWLAASIHPGEEDAIVLAHKTLTASHPGLVTILAPRHLSTADLVESSARAHGVSTTRRSAGDDPAGLYIADTLGELGVFMAIAPVTFLGGSLVPLSGHNPAEPAAHASALLTGPSYGSMFDPFLNGGAAREVADGTALTATVARLLNAADERAAMVEGAAAVLAAERGATDRTMAALAPLLAAAKAL
ncbi:MAG: 3-deoxy-D-manno-octulosonic acid transferase [Pseudomonadota bacterium]